MHTRDLSCILLCEIMNALLQLQIFKTDKHSINFNKTKRPTFYENNAYAMQIPKTNIGCSCYQARLKLFLTYACWTQVHVTKSVKA